MRKTVAMLLAMAMTVSLTACGGGEKPADATTAAPAAETTAASGGEETTAKAAEVEDPYAALGDFTMIVGHAQPEGNPRYESMEKFSLM